MIKNLNLFYKTYKDNYFSLININYKYQYNIIYSKHNLTININSNNEKYLNENQIIYNLKKYSDIFDFFLKYFDNSKYIIVDYYDQITKYLFNNEYNVEWFYIKKTDRKVPLKIYNDFYLFKKDKMKITDFADQKILYNLNILNKVENNTLFVKKNTIKKMKLLIINNVNYHYEIIPSLIEKFDEIIGINKIFFDIYLKCNYDESFYKYIFSKYPFLIFTIEETGFDYIINNNYKNEIVNENTFYINHRVVENQHKNIYYLTPISNKNIFNADILPYMDLKYKSDIPIFIVQGNLVQSRRNFLLIEKVLKYINKPYKIKLIGRLRKNSPLSSFLINEKVIIKTGLNYEDFHKEFLDAYCIMPLIDKENYPQYYNEKLTSSINYGKAYKLKFLVDKELRELYSLNNYEEYTNDYEFLEKFNIIIDNFYANNDLITS